VGEILESALPSETPVELRPDRGGRPVYGGVVVGQEVDGNVDYVSSAFPEQKLAVYCDSAEWHLREDRWQNDIRQRNELHGLGWSFQSTLDRKPSDTLRSVPKKLL